MEIRNDFRGIFLLFHFPAILLIAHLFAVSIHGQNTKLNAATVCPTLVNERLRTPTFISKAGRVSGVLEELAAQREHFLATGDAVDLFPTVYFHTTKAEFDRVIKGESLTPETTLDLIIAFYDAYKANRMRFDAKGSGAVEKHWKRYYKGAIEANRSQTRSDPAIAAILLDGVDAHIVYDLPRAIRSVIPTSQRPPEEAKFEYDKMNGNFSGVAEKTHHDVIAARKVSGWFASLDKIFGLGAKYVVNSRNLAWEQGVSGERLRTKHHQPVFPHDDRSRAYFAVSNDDPRCKTMVSIR